MWAGDHPPGLGMSNRGVTWTDGVVVDTSIKALGLWNLKAYGPIWFNSCVLWTSVGLDTDPFNFSPRHLFRKLDILYSVL